MNTAHAHIWKTRYVTIGGTDQVSGMLCSCGTILDQDDLVELVNERAKPEGQRKYSLSEIDRLRVLMVQSLLLQDSRSSIDPTIAEEQLRTLMFNGTSLTEMQEYFDESFRSYRAKFPLL